MSKKDTHTGIDEKKLSRVQTQTRSCAQKLIAVPDARKAEKMIGEQAGNDFDQEFGGELQALECDANEIEERCHRSMKLHLELEDQKWKTHSHIKAAPDAEDRGQTPFSGWQTKDKCGFVTSVFVMALVLLTGSANVYANYMSSGEAVFLESPWIAGLLSVLLPCASIALKFVGDYLGSDRARRRYIQVLFLLAVIVLLAWTGLFAMNFHGVSGGLDLEDLTETGQSSAALTWMQILAEMLCAAILFHVAWDIYARYTRGALIPNPEYERLERQIVSTRKAFDAEREKRNRTRARLVQLQSMRRAYINEQVAWYLDMRGRWNGGAS